jgi:hypothetical protein
MTDIGTKKNHNSFWPLYLLLLRNAKDESPNNERFVTGRRVIQRNDDDSCCGPSSSSRGSPVIGLSVGTLGSAMSAVEIKSSQKKQSDSEVVFCIGRIVVSVGGMRSE